MREVNTHLKRPFLNGIDSVNIKTSGICAKLHQECHRLKGVLEVFLNIEIKSHRFCNVYFSLFDYLKSRILVLINSFIYYCNLFIYYYD